LAPLLTYGSDPGSPRSTNTPAVAGTEAKISVSCSGLNAIVVGPTAKF
jgi:hypothetical protein